MARITVTVVAAAAHVALVSADLHAVPTPRAGYIVGEQSSAAGDQWTIVPDIPWGPDFSSPTTLTINRAATAQTMIGWGAAMTDTSGFNVISV